MKKLLINLIVFSTAIHVAYGQVTTSGLRGSILDENHETLPGATILAVHEPSGTQYGTIANQDGRFVIGNMRVGGPYKVTVSFIGYTSQIINDVFLSLGSVADLQVTMPKATKELQEVVVTASKNGIFNSDHTGAATNISNEEMTSIPTISRGLKDFTKISPPTNVYL